MFAFVAALDRHHPPTADTVPGPPSKAATANHSSESSCISVTAPPAPAPTKTAPAPTSPAFACTLVAPPSTSPVAAPTTSAAPTVNASAAVPGTAPATALVLTNSPWGPHPTVTLSEAGSSVSGSPLLDSAATHVGGSSGVMPNHRSGKPPSLEGAASDGADWVVEAIVCGDGSTDDRGHELENGVMYGSANALGRHESYHPVDMDTANFSTHDGEAVQLRTRWVPRDVTLVTRDRKYCPLPAEAMTRGACVTSRKLVVARAVERFCRINKGLAVIIGGVGARESNNFLAPHFVRELGCIPEKGSNGRCVKAALVNAVVCLRGAQAARNARVMLQGEVKQFENLKPVGIIAHELRLNARNHKHMRRAISKDKFKGAFGLVAGLRRGVWIAHRCQPKVVDHSVAIDAERGLIFDSAEKFPVRLSAETLRMCGAESATELQVAEVREIVDISP